MTPWDLLSLTRFSLLRAHGRFCGSTHRPSQSVVCRASLLTPPSVGLATHFNSPCTVLESNNVTANIKRHVSVRDDA